MKEKDEKFLTDTLCDGHCYSGCEFLNRNYCTDYGWDRSCSILDNGGDLSWCPVLTDYKEDVSGE